MTVRIPAGDQFDHALRSNRRPGTRFVLDPGVHVTKGAWAFEEWDCCMLAPECEIVGDRSTIALSNSPATKVDGKVAGYYEVLTAGARTKDHSDRISVRDVTIQCAKLDRNPVIGFHAWSSRVRLERVNVENVEGYRDHPGPVREGFGIIVNNAAEATVDGGHEVVDCEVQTVRSSRDLYVNAVYVGPVLRENPMLFSRVARVRAVSFGAHAAFGLNDRTTFTDCDAHGFDRVFFSDTGSGSDVTMERIFASRCRWALSLEAQKETDSRERIVLRDSKFLFVSGSGWSQAVLLVDAMNAGVPAGAVMRDIGVSGCQFVAGGINASKGRSRGPRIGAVRSAGNTWTGPSGDEFKTWNDPVLQDGAAPWLEVA